MWKPEDYRNGFYKNSDIIKSKMGLSMICHVAFNEKTKVSVPLDGIASLYYKCRYPDLVALNSVLSVPEDISLSEFIKNKYGQESHDILQYWLDLSDYEDMKQYWKEQNNQSRKYNIKTLF